MFESEWSQERCWAKAAPEAKHYIIILSHRGSWVSLAKSPRVSLFSVAACRKRLFLGDADPNEYPLPAALHRWPWATGLRLSPAETEHKTWLHSASAIHFCCFSTEEKKSCAVSSSKMALAPLRNPSNGPTGSRFAATRLWREVMMAYWPVCCLSNKASSKRKTSYFSCVGW